MHICFDLLGCGLGNNGGCRTILKSQEAIENLGHRCEVATRIDRFTWFGHKKPVTKIPTNTDVVIATGCNTVNNPMPKHLDKKFWWVRAHESWVMAENKLKELYALDNVDLLVNSECLQEMLVGWGISSKILYQGVDLNFWKDTKKRKDKIRIGCLYSSKPRKRWEDFRKLSSLLGNKYEYVAVGDNKCKDRFLSSMISNPTPKEMRDLYSSCHIWFAPTESEGLHNVPMEAALCGCLMVCNSASLSGMKDYAIPNETAMVYSVNQWREAADMIRNADFSLVDKAKQIIQEKIGDREINMKKLIREVS